MLSIHNSLLVFNFFRKIFRIIWIISSISSQKKKWSRLTSFPRPSFLPFLKTAGIFILLYSSITSFCYDLSQMIKGGLTITLTRSPYTHECIPSLTMDMCMFGLFKLSLIPFSFTEESPLTDVVVYPLKMPSQRLENKGPVLQLVI